MYLNKGTWYVRLFFLAVGIWDEFRDRDTLWLAREETNLCYFIRVILVWMPFVLLLHLCLVAAAIFAAIYWPIHLFGTRGYGTGLAGVAVIVFLVVGTVVGTKWFLKRRRAEPRVTKAAVEKQPGFLSLVVTAAVASKKKICPIIRFTE